MDSLERLKRRMEKYERTRMYKELYICHSKGCKIRITPPDKLCVSCAKEKEKKERAIEHVFNKANREAVYMRLRLDGFM